MSNQSNFENVLQAADIVSVISNYINVHKAGRNHKALCPFHDDKNPSLMISQEKKIYKCFVCGAGGNAINFVANYEKISVQEALVKVAAIVGYKLPDYVNNKPKLVVNEKLEPLYKCLEDLTAYYQYCLTTEEGQTAATYLNNRGLGENYQKRYKIGYSLDNGRATIEYLTKKGHSLKTIEEIGILSGQLEAPFDLNHGRLMFPITNYHNQIVGFSARFIGNDKSVSKYINSPETPVFKKNQILYNYHDAEMSARRSGHIYVLEGFMDVYALNQVGIENVVALMGTAFTKEHILLLRRLNVEVRICLDGDAAGQMAVARMIDQLAGTGISYQIVSAVNEERDPDEILKQSGPDALKKYLTTFISMIDFQLHHREKELMTMSGRDRSTFVNNLLPLVAALPSKMEQQTSLAKIAKLTGFTLAAVQGVFDDFARPKAKKMTTSVNERFPERKLVRMIQKRELAVLRRLLTSKEASLLFQSRGFGFEDEIYRIISDYLADYYQNHEKVDFNDVVMNISTQDNFPRREEVISELTGIEIDDVIVPPYSEQSFLEAYNLLAQERVREESRSRQTAAMHGKDDHEKAAIIAKETKRRLASEKKEKK